MAKRDEAQPGFVPDDAPRVAPGTARVLRNHGAIHASQHVFWEAGYVATDPEELSFLARTGAQLEIGE